METKIPLNPIGCIQDMLKQTSTLETKAERTHMIDVLYSYLIDNKEWLWQPERRNFFLNVISKICELSEQCDPSYISRFQFFMETLFIGNTVPQYVKQRISIDEKLKIEIHQLMSRTS